MQSQAKFCPAQIGATLHAVKWRIDELGIDSFRAGDVVMHNAPYRSGCHIPEHAVIRLIFFGGENYRFVANKAHVTENRRLPRYGAKIGLVAPQMKT